MGPEKNIEYQFMENYQIKYEAHHGPVPAYQFRENISLHSISLERVYCNHPEEDVEKWRSSPGRFSQDLAKYGNKKEI